MALDHYVPQVHLRNFCAPDLSEMMRAIRKSNFKQFHCKPKDVCRIEGGSTNTYLTEERAIEDFLLNVEPKYNASVAKLREGAPDVDAILAIAGFAAYVGTCSPAAMRIHSQHLRSEVQSSAKILDHAGLIPPAPPSLGGKTISQLLADGGVVAKIDPKFPQAVGISNVLGLTSLFGNAGWELLQNNDEGSPFFTSDYPLVLEPVPHSRIPNWIVPLTPAVALRVVPDPAMQGRAPDLSFSNFRFRRQKVGHQDVRALNQLIVRCAEDLVFYGIEHHWVAGFVAKHRAYRVDVVTDRIPSGSGFLNVSRQRIVEHCQG
jgi:hypothetical protein